MPYDAAKGFLNEVWGNRGLPVDPVLIAKELGIEVVEADLPEDVSGALIKDGGKDPVIFLNASDSKARKRFSCAHEIGHYINRKSASNENYEYVDLRSLASSKGKDPEEIYANRFAAELLIPEERVRAFHKEGFPSFIMAIKFGVSDEAVRNRLKNLKLA